MTAEEILPMYKYTCHICGFVTDNKRNLAPIYAMVDHVNTHVKGVTVVSIADWCRREPLDD